jgi:hypothetical protein
MNYTGQVFCIQATNNLNCKERIQKRNAKKQSQFKSCPFGKLRAGSEQNRMSQSAAFSRKFEIRPTGGEKLPALMAFAGESG